MEKNKPSCPLAYIKSMVSRGLVRYTRTSIATAYALGFRRKEILDEVMSLKADEFYKSMTTYKDAHIWQDVYHHKTARGDLYVKLTVTDEVLVVSFKEL